MGNVLDNTEQQRIVALGRLGWTALRIQQATGIRRETVSAYLKAAGIPVRGRGRPREGTAKPATSQTIPCREQKDRVVTAAHRCRAVDGGQEPFDISLREDIRQGRQSIVARAGHGVCQADRDGTLRRGPAKEGAQARSVGSTRSARSCSPLQGSLHISRPDAPH
jgi:hypothetical protein